VFLNSAVVKNNSAAIKMFICFFCTQSCGKGTYVGGEEKMWLYPIDTKILQYGIFSHPDLLENMSMAAMRDIVHFLVIFK
jgi:hypothetical protein